MDPQSPITPDPLAGQPPIQPQPGQSFQPDVIQPVPAEEVTSDVELPIQTMSAPVEPTQPDFVPPVAPAEPTPAAPMFAADAPQPAVQVQPDLPQPAPAEAFVPSYDPVPAPQPVAPVMPAFMTPTQPVAPVAPVPPLAPPAGAGPLPQPGQGDPMQSAVPPVAPKKKSKFPLPLIIAAVVVILLIGGGAAFALTKKGGKSADSGGDAKKDDTKPNSSIVADSQYDFDEVCKGGAVSNAAAYTTGKESIIEMYHNNPANTDTWSSDGVGYGKSYYLKSDDDFTKISVVGCVEYVADSAKQERTCDGKSGDEAVTIAYHSSKYKLTFYEAKTRKKISDGGEVNAPANSCPSYMTYDKTTKKAYANRDDGALEAAADKFAQ